ncbi:glucose repressible protein Grg1 [Metarhizium album ARSEF 1941]|uniref:Glucose repressible protein Grg1 n=1 Tax=Metarhizium album (strain ARSEF 1941) TaxID=1081103 RepID=A0A0B2WJN7_METAS|nr:glucose repressible protein Grg1 [Metarhizium album ARSEF 1941]KHN93697.1 glucose repressible protein Grg1 [Metarhizium album ARSEF 1941]
MESLKQGANYVSEQAKKATTGTSKEANKNIAKDSDAPVGDRVSAAKDTVADKSKEQQHDVKAEAHKQQM